MCLLAAPVEYYKKVLIEGKKRKMHERRLRHQYGLYPTLLSLVLLLPCLAVTHGQEQGARHRSTAPPPTTQHPVPNILLFMADDLGFGDLGCYGNTSLRTPNIDRLASEGVKMTQSLAAASVCTPSRAAFMTGRYAVRSGMAPSGKVKVPIFTASGCGLSTRELTISRLAKQAGHVTALLGKWHLGWSEDRGDPHHHHPLSHGFDYFYGLPLTLLREFDPREIAGWRAFRPSAPWTLALSFLTLALVTWLSLRMLRVGHVGRMVVVGVGVMVLLLCGTFVLLMENMALLNSFMYRDYDLVEQPVVLTQATRKLVREGAQFLEQRGKDKQPFLLMVSWLHVHTALAVGPAFRGRSAHGPYGDAVEEMDWGVGEMLRTLERQGLGENTLVYFTSDNGGHVEEVDFVGRQAGGWNGVLKGGKTHGAPDGGIRVPTLLKWPAGAVPAGVTLDEPVSLMDVLPTLAQALRVELTLPPSATTTRGRGADGDGDLGQGQGRLQVPIDGRDLLPLLRGEVKVSPHEFLFHYCGTSVHAVRYRPREGTRTWKLVLYQPAYLPGTEQCLFVCVCEDAVRLQRPLLFDLTSDPGERRPLASDSSPEYRALTEAMLRALQGHTESLEPPVEGDMFSLGKLMWRPWRQPFCNFPRFQCSDPKFDGLFEED